MHNRRFETQPQTPTNRCMVRPSVEAERARSRATQRRTGRAWVRNRFLACLLLLAFSTTGRQAMGQGEWADGFGFPGPGLDGAATAFAVFDDGTGPALYAGGSFTTAGGVVANNIAKWDGSTWSPLGTGMDYLVSALTVFDDGSGPALYAGGFFTTAGEVSVNNIAKWNGSTWSPLGSGMNSIVDALTIFDDGTGPALYASGQFTTAGGTNANNVAKWDGSTWSALGNGKGGGTFNTRVLVLTVVDDGTGPALYAGGRFTTAGTDIASNIAKWDGLTWSKLGAGIGGGFTSVSTITSFDDGTGTALYAGGTFTTAGGVSANNIAKWDGSTWSPLGSGTSGSVQTLTVFDDRTGAALYAGGWFTTAGGASVNRIARWNGSTWSPLDSGLNSSVEALVVFDAGSGPALYAGGYFSSAGGVSANGVAKWNGSAWSALAGTVPSMGINDSVAAMTVFDDGTGLALYAGGDFTTAGGVFANNIAKWDGSTWSPLGIGTSGGSFFGVSALAVFDDGTGPALYAAGTFTTAGGLIANHIARWDGSVWSRVGSRAGSGVNGRVRGLTVFDNGTGPALYAGGDFTTAGGVNANHIAKWNGSTWSPVGDGMNDWVHSLAVFDDGTGPALYAGGRFTTAGSVSAEHIAKWNGAAWSPLGGGVRSGSVFPPSVNALTVFDDGTGLALYAGGTFTTAGTDVAFLIAKWNGLAWSRLRAGIGEAFSSSVSALTSFDDGTGSALYVGGRFRTAGGASAYNIAKWNGSAWFPIGSGTNNSVLALNAFDDGTGSTLYAGGFFMSAGGKPSSRIGAWRPDCNGNGIPNGCDVECGVACARWSGMPGCGASVDFNGNRIPDECDLFGDCNRNDVVDLGDGRIFGDCISGPGVAVDALDACRCDDLNGDGFVDLRDAAEFGSFFGSSR